MRYVLREDQWICTRCGTENKKDRRVCCKCKAFIKYADRSDDWYCPANDCARSNYGSRSVCFKCGTARQEAGEIFDSENFDINCRLQIHNLNYETTEEEVQEFFSPLQVQHTITCKGIDDKPTGRMNVYFYNRQDAEEALEKVSADHIYTGV